MKNVKIYDLAQIIGMENIEFGQHIIIDDFAFIYAKKRITIGNYVQDNGCATQMRDLFPFQ